jgi:hypothetical protein
VTDEDRNKTVRLALSAIARDGDANGVLGDLAPLHPKHNTFPGELFLELGADARAGQGQAASAA